MHFRSPITVPALVAVALLATSVSPLDGYSLEGQTWPAGATIPINLQLGSPSFRLKDGTVSWNAAAAEALAIWNPQLQTVQFSWSMSASSQGVQGDGVNSAFFSSTVYGQSFGTGVLAVTLYHYDTSNHAMLEADTIFDTAVNFDSYRGPTQFDPRTHRATYDFRRVALHEFGHTLGLTHPDERGQTVTAIMNSHVSDLDTLSEDDIAGAHFLYGYSITSPLYQQTIEVGEPFRYTIAANNSPTSFSVLALPPGLQLDAATGALSGAPTQVGTFTLTLLAHSSAGDATGTLQLTVVPRRITSYTPGVAEFDTPFSYQITADNNPTSFEATGLPSGLTLDTATGVISGAPAASGTFSVSVIAHGVVGDAVGTFNLGILAPRITSSLTPAGVRVGDTFAFQITATNKPVSYIASGPLPAGLTLNQDSGAISGVPTLSGLYNVPITVHGLAGDVTATLQLRVVATANVTPSVTTFPGLAGAITADPYRPRMYLCFSASIVVIDTTTLNVVTTIPLSTQPLDTSVSVDGSTLWVAGIDQTIGRIDLTTFTVLSAVRVPVAARQVREGLGGRLYLSAAYTGGVVQVDAMTGAFQTSINPNVHTIEISPDRKILFVGDLSDVDPMLVKYDVTGPTPVLIQTVSTPTNSSSSLALSHDGQAIIFSERGVATERSTTDLSTLYGAFILPASIGPMTYSADDSLLFQSTRSQSFSDQNTVAVFDAKTFGLLRTITLPETLGLSILAVDSTNSYLFVSTGNGGPFLPAAVRVFPVHPRALVPAPHSLANVSTRTLVEDGDGVEIGGFIIQGAQPKKVMLRAIAPSLATFGVTNAMPDPTLEIHNSSGIVSRNDNWNTHRQDVLANGLAPKDEHEAALVLTLQPGSYTAVLSGVNGGSGVALCELYDLDPGASRIANISTRGKVGVGDNVMIGGFVIGGDQATAVAIRAIGPSLAGFGVTGALQDPVLELHDGNGVVIARNDNWRSDQAQEIINAGLAPADDRESVILATLNGGNYTAVVHGANNSSGIALVEVFNLALPATP